MYDELLKITIRGDDTCEILLIEKFKKKFMFFTISLNRNILVEYTDINDIKLLLNKKYSFNKLKDKIIKSAIQSDKESDFIENVSDTCISLNNLHIDNDLPKEIISIVNIILRD